MILGWRAHPRYALVVAANRDEFHARPAAPLAPWEETPAVLAGRDLKAGGTWLGVDTAARFGIVTNFRELQPPRADAPTRGALVPDFLRGSASADDYAAAIAPAAAEHAGYNLLFADAQSLWYASNRTDEFARPLAPGIHGVSNHVLDTPWPKLERVRRGFERLLDEPRVRVDALLALLADRTRSQDGNVPPSGRGADWDDALSAPFVVHTAYGTRCSTIVLIGHDGAVHATERRFDAHGNVTGTSSWNRGAEGWLPGAEPALAGATLN